MAISSSGDISARSSSIRIRNTTTSTTGMITLLSRSEAVFVSSQNAEPPPTKASAPSTSWTASRVFSTMSNAAVDETSAPIVASK